MLYRFPTIDHVRLIATVGEHDEQEYGHCRGCLGHGDSHAVRSEYPIAPPRLLFFVRLRYWLMSGGMMTRSAWGR